MSRPVQQKESQHQLPAESDAALQQAAQAQQAEPESEEQQVSAVTSPSVGTRFSAKEIYENVRVAAQEELKRPASALIWSSIAAGLTIGFSFFAAGYLSSIAAPGFSKAAAA